jgi:hypothetical protein
MQLWNAAGQPSRPEPISFNGPRISPSAAGVTDRIRKDAQVRTPRSAARSASVDEVGARLRGVARRYGRLVHRRRARLWIDIARADLKCRPSERVQLLLLRCSRLEGALADELPVFRGGLAQRMPLAQVPGVRGIGGAQRPDDRGRGGVDIGQRRDCWGLAPWPATTTQYAHRSRLDPAAAPPSQRRAGISLADAPAPSGRQTPARRPLAG